MKRRLILLIIVIVFLAGFGAILHSPPSIVDAVTGATPKAKKAAQESAQLEGSYVFCINSLSEGLNDENVRDEMKTIALESSNEKLTEAEIGFSIYVSESDYALVKYAKKLCERFEKIGIDVKLKEYSSTILYSRVVSGKYDVFLASEDFLDVTTLEQGDYILLDSDEMR
ncbi:MAG: DUF6921 family protein [Roseburia sp.]